MLPAENPRLYSEISPATCKLRQRTDKVRQTPLGWLRGISLLETASDTQRRLQAVPCFFLFAVPKLTPRQPPRRTACTLTPQNGGSAWCTCHGATLGAAGRFPRCPRAARGRLAPSRLRLFPAAAAARAGPAPRRAGPSAGMHLAH